MTYQTTSQVKRLSALTLLVTRLQKCHAELAEAQSDC